MSKEFSRIRRTRFGHVEQKQLYVTYDGYCQCNCACCRNKSFSEESMMGKRYILDEVLRENYNQFRHIIFGGGEPLYKIDKIWDLIVDLDSRNILFAKSDDDVTKYSIVTNGAREIFLDRFDSCMICRRFETVILSRYHYDDEINLRIFNPRRGEELLTTEDLQEDVCEELRHNKMQLSCLCQKGGINTVEDVIQYLKWAAKVEIPNVMFSNFQDDVTPLGAKQNLSCNPELLEKVKEELRERGFSEEEPIIFDAGFRVTKFTGIIEYEVEVEGTIFPPELQLMLALTGLDVPTIEAEAMAGVEMTVSIKEFIPENQLRKEWRKARRRTYNYSAMPNGDLFSDWSCGKKL